VHDKNHPVHLTLRAARRVPNLRSQIVFLALRRAMAKTWREWFRVLHFSVQSDHIHLVAEAADRVALSRGMAGLGIRLARTINRMVGRKGNVFSDRYHARSLATPREVRNAWVNVLLNFRKHLDGRADIDPRSSGFWFHGWKTSSGSQPPDWTPDEVVPVRPPRTWLAKVGWRRHGLIAFHERPA
jgi:REP element-mobilizing transposase RayT